MKILALSGSSRTDSTTQNLSQHLQSLAPKWDFEFNFSLHDLPLFHADIQHQKNSFVSRLIDQIMRADALIIITPEYLHNIPASLKNALEWCTTSGVIKAKKTLAICYTPTAPRGEQAMTSLLFSLKALDANVITTLLLHHTDIAFNSNGEIVNNGGQELLLEMLKLIEINN